MVRGNLEISGVDRSMADSCILVTGAGGGIGSALARRLVARGDSVVLMGRRPEPLQILASELGPSAFASPGDAGSEEDLNRAVRAALEHFDRVDGLAHCVGSIILKPIHLCTPAEFLAAIQTNLVTAFLACRAVLPELRKVKSGSIVLVSTVAVGQGLNNHDVIAAAKGGIEAMVRSAAITHARWNVRFNAVAPGMTQTPLSAPSFRPTPRVSSASRCIPWAESARPTRLPPRWHSCWAQTHPGSPARSWDVDGGLRGTPPRVASRRG